MVQISVGNPPFSKRNPEEFVFLVTCAAAAVLFGKSKPTSGFDFIQSRKIG
jgi:hypothetical protein